MKIAFFSFYLPLLASTIVVNGQVSSRVIKGTDVQPHHRRLFNEDGTVYVNGALTSDFSLFPFDSTRSSDTTQIFRMVPDPIPATSVVQCTLICNTPAVPNPRLAMKFGSIFTSTGGPNEFITPCGSGFSVISPSTAATGYVMVYAGGPDPLIDAKVYCNSLQVPNRDGFLSATPNGYPSFPFDLETYGTSQNVKDTTEMFSLYTLPAGSVVTFIRCTVPPPPTPSPTTPLPTRSPTPYPTYPTNPPYTYSPTHSPAYYTILPYPIYPTFPHASPPTNPPTKAPTKVPTKAPSKAPSKAPTKVPTKAPTKAPTREDGTVVVNGALTSDFSLVPFDNGNFDGSTQIFRMVPDPIPATSVVQCTLICNTPDAPNPRLAMKFGSIFTSTLGPNEFITPCGSGFSVISPSTAATGYVMVYAGGPDPLIDAKVYCNSLQVPNRDGFLSATPNVYPSFPFGLHTYGTSQNVKDTTEMFSLYTLPAGSVVTCEVTCDSGQGIAEIKFGSPFGQRGEGTASSAGSQSCPFSVTDTTPTQQAGYVLVYTTSSYIINAVIRCTVPPPSTPSPTTPLPTRSPTPYPTYPTNPPYTYSPTHFPAYYTIPPSTNYPSHSPAYYTIPPYPNYPTFSPAYYTIPPYPNYPTYPPATHPTFSPAYYTIPPYPIYPTFPHASPPTNPPTKAPSKAPTKVPTKTPTKAPATPPTKAPATQPTKSPTKAPATPPTKAPATQPTKSPTKAPTTPPTKAPATQPTKAPTTPPTRTPATQPTKAPTIGMGGDPHVTTWGGTSFDYHGECDLVLLHSPSIAETKLTFDLHVRTRIRQQYSFIESAELRIGEDTLEVASFIDYALNGVDTPFRHNGHQLTLAGLYPIYHIQSNKKKHTFDVVISPTLNITFITFRDIVSIKMDGGVQGHELFGEGGSTGIMGSSLDGTLLFRNGTYMMSKNGDDDMIDTNAFGQEWQVRDDEPMLFRSARDPQYPQKCLLPSLDEQKEQRQRRLGERTLAIEQAKEACSEYSGAAFENCVDDVMVVGDVEMAKSGAY